MNEKCKGYVKVTIEAFDCCSVINKFTNIYSNAVLICTHVHSFIGGFNGNSLRAAHGSFGVSVSLCTGNNLGMVFSNETAV